jgi:sulfatase maturation enzyme AslB (radical SAM superfamily)
MHNIDLKFLESKEWQVFNVDGDHYLWHVPSSHLLAVNAKTAEAAAAFEAGNPPSQDLRALSEKLPQAIKRELQPLKITAIALNVAETCNLRCNYCYAGDGNYGEDTMMPNDTAFKAVDFLLAQTDKLHIVFFGGEPLLNFKLVKSVVDYCKTKVGKTFSYAMTTNGVLLLRRQRSPCQATLEYGQSLQLGGSRYQKNSAAGQATGRVKSIYAARHRSSSKYCPC